ncbi:hypothetical protein SISNIDRAFT_461645 [Sistotremastrum niveocremeum HHB9708]|uniref:Uncharacterized protein n=2 Tax=Sistotremastraceae TaxID=3402574 RepID=A0A164MAN2_9AGAM|nr:hypothetical protein SISNIDRAFT_461645 [Sistotremastrum niveocremeum HHB9708]KZT34268.1 hypothetical protein SISSUDRAFT_1053094 [Sistotremastrum suecicum HHB10207 ss-3]
MEYGHANLASGLKEWQSSGILRQGCSDPLAKIKSCYDLSLTSNPSQQLDPGFPSSPRQRIEFRTNSQKAGSTASYTWKQTLQPTSTSTHFFHLMQVFDEPDGTPVMTLDAVNGNARIVDYSPQRQNCGGGCPTIPISQYTGITTLHSLRVTFGANGSAVYTVSNAVTGKQLLSYKPKGYMGGSSSYVKFGVYRSTYPGQSDVSSSVGDFALQ